MADSSFLYGCEPPWLAWPQIVPDELPQYLKQGATEAWFDQQWRPFWNSLSLAQRSDYLRFWRASPAWRDAIAFCFGPDTDVGREQDARESEALLSSEHKRPPRKAGLLSRLFRRES
jgi:hypothetical protein